jgi:hypothetical protein
MLHLGGMLFRQIVISSSFSNGFQKEFSVTNPDVGLSHLSMAEPRNTKYHCTIDLLLGWFGLFCFAN